MELKGSIPALITPFDGGEVNFTILNQLIDWHVEQGSSALVICGTTGESPTLDHDEQISIIRQAVEMANGQIPIIAGTGSNCTDEALYLSKAAQDAGADYILHATGYYNNPTQGQVISHFEAINDAVSIPIIVYNIPSRTGMELTVDSISKLAELSNICGVKDSTGSVDRVTLEKKVISKPFSFLSGDDSTALGYMAHGGHGCISVTANIAPKQCAKMFKAALDGDFESARRITDSLMPMHKALFLEPSPAGIKYAMSEKGLCPNELRRPLTPVSADAQKVIDHALMHLGEE